MNDSNMALWYREPANRWIDGMPLGNGRLGAMVLGKLRNETIVMNDDTVWARGPENRNNPDALDHLPGIRRLLMNGQVEKAHALAEAAMIGVPRNQAPYQVLGELALIFTDHVDDSIEIFRQDESIPQAQAALRGRISGYDRRLNLDTAIATVEYTMNGTQYKREYFISQPDGVFVVHLTASQSGSLNLLATLFRKLDAQTSPITAQSIELRGQCGRNGASFRSILHADVKGGKCTVIGNHLNIENADEVTLFLSNETDVRTGDYAEVCKERINAVIHQDYNTILRRHLDEYQSYFLRMQMTLPAESSLRRLSTRERLERVRAGEQDNGLIALYFHFGRYLLIASSRPGSMPANLQGIWCDSYTPPWDSKYTININTQMNYWGAEACNLGDCHQPLFDMIERMRVNGRITAKTMYGCNGFVAHHNTDLWGDTAPLDHTRAGLWPMGAAWLCYHLWQHYEYGCSLSFLKETAYPVMKEAAEFFLEYLFDDGNGQLLSGPSLSPENRFITPDGQIGWLCLSPAMDVQILDGLFRRCLAAAKVLGIHDSFTEDIEKCLNRLPPVQIDNDGCLREWREDVVECEPGHRHVSHLFAIYPGEEITKPSSPELFQAAHNSLQRRIQNGCGGTGWNLAWVAALQARFGRGDLAYSALQKLLGELTADSLLDLHPPGVFQIDGNLGAVAAILEMLLQDDGDNIILFPALPYSWDSGSINGLRAKGGLTVDIVWSVSGNTTITFSASLDIRRDVYAFSTDAPLVATLEMLAGETRTITFDL